MTTRKSVRIAALEARAAGSFRPVRNSKNMIVGWVEPTGSFRTVTEKLSSMIYRYRGASDRQFVKGLRECIRIDRECGDHSLPA